MLTPNTAPVCERRGRPCRAMRALITAFDGAAPQLLLEAISDEETNLRKRAFYIGGKVYREKSAPVRSHAPQSMEIATAIGAPEPDAAASFGEGGTTTSRLH